MAGTYNFRQSSPQGAYSSATMYRAHKINTALESIHDVGVILELFKHPLLLVGDAATHWMGCEWTNTHTIDLLICKEEIERITRMLTGSDTRLWSRPTSLTEYSKSVLGQSYTDLNMVERHADVLLERVEHQKGQCLFLRLWSEKTYHSNIDEQAIFEVPKEPDSHGLGHGFNTSWRCWPAPSSGRCFPDLVETMSQPLNIAGKVYIPTVPALLDALVYQRVYLKGKRNFLCSDADGLIKRLTENNHLEELEASTILSSSASPLETNWLKAHWSLYSRTPWLDTATLIRQARAGVSSGNETCPKTDLGYSIKDDEEADRMQGIETKDSGRVAKSVSSRANARVLWKKINNPGRMRLKAKLAGPVKQAQGQEGKQRIDTRKGHGRMAKSAPPTARAEAESRKTIDKPSRGYYKTTPELSTKREEDLHTTQGIEREEDVDGASVKSMSPAASAPVAAIARTSSDRDLGQGYCDKWVNGTRQTMPTRKGIAMPSGKSQRRKRKLDSRSSGPSRPNASGSESGDAKRILQD